MDIEKKYKEIQDIYLSQNKPFIIGFSGGKDSTVALQLVWNALLQIKDKLKNPVYIVSSDTLVEIPKVINYVDKTLEKIKEAALKEELPFYVEKVFPDIRESFWVNIIGKGYSAPTRLFRWCTDRLKIKPTNKFVKEKVSKYGEIIVVLGVRSSESINRNKSIKNNSIEDSLFLKHNSLKGALIYPIIRDWSVEDVWDYLLRNPSPFGIDNRELFALYKQANAGDCPVIVELKEGSESSSCGNSRFGCWTCTVVEKEKSLSSLIENGEEWLKPLQEYRQFLLESSKKPELREYKRRNGKICIKNGKLYKGGFKLEFRKVLLEKLLETEKQVGIRLIRNEELSEIRRIWIQDDADWNDSLNKIHKKVYGKEFIKEALNFAFKEKDKKYLHPLIIKLVNAMENFSNDKNFLINRVEKILKEDWLEEDEILKLLDINTENIKTKDFNSASFSKKQIKILIELGNLLITIKEKYINKKKLKDQDKIIKNIDKAENLINLYKGNQKTANKKCVVGE
jgi:DNA sulfur modification protein DndC